MFSATHLGAFSTLALCRFARSPMASSDFPRAARREIDQYLRSDDIFVSLQFCSNSSAVRRPPST